MSVVDASVWVSRFWPDDAFYAISNRWLKQRTRDGDLLLAPTIMLAEVAGAIARRTGDRQLGLQIVDQIAQIPTLQLISVDTAMGHVAAQIASNYQLRGADAIYVAVASQLQMPLVSWDKEHASRVSGLIEAYTPDNAGQ